MYLSSKTNWRTFNTYHSALFKGSVSLIMDLKIGFLFRFSFDKDIHYCLGSIKKIHWYKIKVYCLEYSCLQRSRHWFPQLRKFWVITGGICLSILTIFLLFLYCSKWLWQICGYHWDFYINHYFACPNNQHILINSSRWHLIDFVTRFQTKTTIVVALFLGLFQILGQVWVLSLGPISRFQGR